LHIKIII